jgi:hypothetical protein
VWSLISNTLRNPLFIDSSITYQNQILFWIKYHTKAWLLKEMQVVEIEGSCARIPSRNQPKWFYKKMRTWCKSTNSITLSQFDTQFAIATPLMPSPKFIIKVQHRKTCIKVVRPLANTIGKTIFCVCRNLTMHLRRPLAEKFGIE